MTVAGRKGFGGEAAWYERTTLAVFVIWCAIASGSLSLAARASGFTSLSPCGQMGGQ